MFGGDNPLTYSAPGHVSLGTLLAQGLKAPETCGTSLARAGSKIGQRRLNTLRRIHAPETRIACSPPSI